jgi:hypothetical protein
MYLDPSLVFGAFLEETKVSWRQRLNIAAWPSAQHASYDVRRSTEDMNISASEPPYVMPLSLKPVYLYISVWFLPLFSCRSRNFILSYSSTQNPSGCFLIQLKFVRFVVSFLYIFCYISYICFIIDTFFYKTQV